MWENVQQVVRDVTKNPSPPVCVDIPTGDTLLVSSSADTRYNKALFIKKTILRRDQVFILLGFYIRQ